MRKGTLEVETASGSRFTVGDGSGERVAVRLADLGAVWQLILRPELALGELYMDGRIVVTQGSVYMLRSRSRRRYSRATIRRQSPAKQEEREARAQFGEAYVKYARRVPAFVPMIGGPGEVAP